MTSSDNDAPVSDIVTAAVAVRELYRKYVAFHSEHENAQSGAMTLFTFYTWVYDSFSFAPIILITAPTSEAGKTRVFDVAELLVREPYVVIDPSGPGMRNLIDLIHPTLMVDEADLLKQSKDLKAILNAGVEKGRMITRAAGRGGVLQYDPFGPKMLAGIYGDEPPLKGATLSRCIQIQVRRRYDRDEPIADFDKTEARIEAIHIKGALETWSLRTDLKALSAYRPAMPRELTDRQRDAWRPLIVIADMIGTEWGQAARQWAVELSRAIPATPDIMVQVLKDTYKVLLNHHTKRTITTKQLAEERNALPDREYDADLSPVALAKRLARFQIKSEKYYQGATQVRGYRVRNAKGEWIPEWADAIGRYRLEE